MIKIFAMTRKGIKKTACVLCLQLLVFGNLHASPLAQGTAFEIGPSVSHITYNEPGYMEDTGFMYGVAASCTWYGEHFGPIQMIKGEGQMTWGQMDYTSNATGSIHGTPDAMFETRVLLGTHLSSEGTTVITPYAGLGYRRLTDKSEGMISTLGAYGYDRESNYYYSPIGIEISSDLERGWSIGAQLEYDYFINGTQITSIPQDMRNNGSTLSNNFTNDQNEGYGLRASIKIIKKIGNAYRLLFEPFCRYWNIKESKPDSIIVTDAAHVQKTVTVVEPANNSTEYGIKVGLEF